MEYFREDARMAEQRIEKELKAIHGRLAALQEQKRRVIDIYATSELSRDGYVEKNRELDGMVEALQARRRELEDNTALLHKIGAIDAGIAQFCEAARVRFTQCNDFATRRQFLLDYVEKVVILKDKVSLHGVVPIKGGEDSETNSLPFCIESEITSDERRREKLRTTLEVQYQQSIALIVQRSPSDNLEQRRRAV
jgi:hypothetical protein